jgi:hypothetical protein
MGEHCWKFGQGLEKVPHSIMQLLRATPTEPRLGVRGRALTARKAISLQTLLHILHWMCSKIKLDMLYFFVHLFTPFKKIKH